MKVDNAISGSGAAYVAVAVVLISLLGCGAEEPASEREGMEPSSAEQAIELSAERESAVYVHGDSGFSGRFPGLSAARDGIDEGRLLWNEESSPRSIVVKDGVLYLVSSEPALWAVEIESGQLLWTHTLEVAVLAPPVVDDTEIWIAAVDGEVQRIGTEHGAVLGVTRLGNTVYRTPLLHGNELLVAAESGIVERVPLTDEGTRGRFRSKGEPQHFLSEDGVVVTVSGEGQIQAFSGDVQAPADIELSYGPDMPNTAALRDGLLYVGGTGFAVYDLHAGDADRTAEQLGRVEELGAAQQILISEYGPLVLDLYGYLHLLDSETLDARFSQELAGEPTTAAVVDSVVYLGTDTGRLYAVELPSGTVLWEIDNANSAVTALFPGNEELFVAYAAEGVLQYYAAAGQGDTDTPSGAAGQLESHTLADVVELGSYLARIHEDGIETKFTPDSTGDYAIQAIGRDGEEILIVLSDEQGREMERNVGYRVEPRLTAELNAGITYGIRLKPVVRGLGPVVVQLNIQRR